MVMVQVSHRSTRLRVVEKRPDCGAVARHIADISSCITGLSQIYLYFAARNTGLDGG